MATTSVGSILLRDRGAERGTGSAEKGWGRAKYEAEKASEGEGRGMDSIHAFAAAVMRRQRSFRPSTAFVVVAARGGSSGMWPRRSEQEVAVEEGAVGGGLRQRASPLGGNEGHDGATSGAERRRGAFEAFRPKGRAADAERVLAWKSRRTVELT